MSPRGKALSPQKRVPSHFPATRTTPLTCFDFSSFCLGENTTSKPHPLLFLLVFGFFCLDCCFFYVVLFFFCRSRHVGECLGVCWVCACLSVFVCSLQLPPLITVPLQTDAAPG